MSDFIPIFQYIKKTGISKQNVYRWIREGKVSDKDVAIKEMKVRRLFIREDFKLPGR